MEPVKFGSKYVHSRAGDYLQLIDPATNTKGVVLRTMSLFSVKLFTGTVKPVYAEEKNYPLLFEVGANHVLNPFPVLLPPGYGLWVSGGNSGVSRISYDVLA